MHFVYYTTQPTAQFIDSENCIYVSMNRAIHIVENSLQQKLNSVGS